MELYALSFLIYWFNHASCKSDIPAGYRVTLPLPPEYNSGFTGRAFVLETGNENPDFRAALSVEAVNGRYSCSLQVFLGDAKVWNSGHSSHFYPSQRCVLELTEDGELQLKGARRRIGWRTRTFGQGVERLQLLGTGNLVLADAMNRIKWQSFDFPTDVMLWGQVLNLSTRLTSFSGNSSSFYSLEIESNKIVLYLNSGSWKYSYWEFRPSKGQNIVSAELGSIGLKLFDRKHRKIAQMTANADEPVRFLALGDKTGNLGLYHYSPEIGKFEASFQALNTTCDLPLACEPYGICTFSDTCACLQLSRGSGHTVSNCSEGFSNGFCGEDHVEMVELEGITSVLRDSSQKDIASKEECENLCLDNCTCVAALYSATGSTGEQGDCILYGLVSGVKRLDKATRMRYLVKVPKGMGEVHGKTSRLKKWLLIMGGVVDGLVILLILGGLGCYFVVRKRRKALLGHDDT
ncbi:PREDICTED: G-type lectin S-receptor-like serine/threonine-protein kinase SD2-5 [Nelumbo nucifera]|uniref:G-type lectin S-receptor-like serine/threonine-protein kinase SD2-5 n=2 Tax=Nelumbo nucifera TaxID=4432 RepID=A0A1U7ZRU9_NELNU|nr:PREDICTED: G-type lectin S-receptor-like serine/threonine-protein kinase SD2-5 [Nelumbo nucifera]DAD26395.1 TPA_asm: hypothetical protein HUJ06_027863 [Nelumbo nucifera]